MNSTVHMSQQYQQHWCFYAWAELSFDQSSGQSPALPARPLKAQATVKTRHASGALRPSSGLKSSPHKKPASNGACKTTSPNIRLTQTANRGVPRSSTAQLKKVLSTVVMFSLRCQRCCCYCCKASSACQQGDTAAPEINWKQ